MDTLCRFLSNDLLCLLNQIYESLGLGSTNSSIKAEPKKGQKNKNNKKIHGNRRFLAKNRTDHKTQEKKSFLGKNRDNQKTKKKNGGWLKNRKNEEIQKDESFMVLRPSYTIHHNYPGPLTTYDGEERGEPRLIRISDLNSSKVEMILNLCEEQDEKEEECEEEQEPECEEEQEQECEEDQEKECEEEQESEREEKIKQECEEEQESEREEKIKQECEVKQENDCEPAEGETPDENQECEEFWLSKKEEFESLVKNLVAKRKGSDSFSTICSEAYPTRKQLRRKELRARTLYEKSTCQNPEAPSWDCLKYTEKLRFHWKAHMGWELQETPFDNFRLSYIKNRRRTCPKLGIRKIRCEMRLRWCNMDRRQRLPFILEALLYQVTTGALDPANHCAVREFFQNVK